MCGALLALLQILTAGHCAGHTSPRGCVSTMTWCAAAGRATHCVLTVCTGGLLYTFCWACCAAEQPSWATPVWTDFPNVPPKASLLHLYWRTTCVKQQLLVSPLSCHYSRFSLDLLNTPPRSWGWLSSGGTGLVSSAPSPLCRSPWTKNCPGRYPTAPGHRGFIGYQRCKVQSLKHRGTANMPMRCTPCWSFAKFIALNACSVCLVPEEHRDCHPAANGVWPSGIRQRKDLNKIYMVEYFLLRQLIDWLCRNAEWKR